jgi:hypothetical protein
LSYERYERLDYFNIIKEEEEVLVKGGPGRGVRATTGPWARGGLGLSREGRSGCIFRARTCTHTRTPIEIGGGGNPLSGVVQGQLGP